MSETQRDAFAECKAVRKSIGSKADNNRLRARLAIFGMAAASSAIPFFLLIGGDDFLLAKAVPAGLAAIGSLGAVVIQFEKYHERWALYRRYQRILEGEELLYRFEVEPYVGSTEERNSLLAKRLAQLQIDLHDEWAGLVPRSHEVSGLREGDRQ